jgi:hypothetical protein
MAAPTPTPTPAKLASAALKLARRQTATLFELRTALDDFELRGDVARAALIDVVERMPADSAWPGTGPGSGRRRDTFPTKLTRPCYAFRSTSMTALKSLSAWSAANLA